MHLKSFLGLLVVLSVGCNGVADDETGSTTVNSDADGDGYIGTTFGGDDCDDDDASLTPADVDEDGYSSCDGDCDDTDPSSTIVTEDGDCDGVVTAEDCDDEDPTSTVVVEDGDCDGFVTAEDCDDADAMTYPGAEEGILNNDLNCDGEVSDSLRNADYSFEGEGSDNYAGHSVSSAGDVDGDGLADILVGAYGHDKSTGKVYLILGNSLGASTNIILSQADYVFVGETSDDYAGFSVSSAGDVDGDGLDDILIGAYGNDAAGSKAGKVYLILGSSLGAQKDINLSQADYSFVGENENDNAGRSVSSAGDVDGDGLDDVFIGAPYNDDEANDAGKAYLILGDSLGDSSTIDLSLSDYSFLGESSSNRAGASVASAGDVDGDGLDDILIGAYQESRAYLIFGSRLAASSSTFELYRADYSFLGENSNDNAGYSVASAGDVDADGLDDILIGAMNYQGNGKTYLVLGGSLDIDISFDLALSDYSFLGDDGEGAGISVSSAGDVDGDGRADILIGANGATFTTERGGKAFLMLGANLKEPSSIDLSFSDYRFLGTNNEDSAGNSVSNAGDVDGDGLDDLLIGAPDNDGGGEDAGKAYLILSRL